MSNKRKWEKTSRKQRRFLQLCKLPEEPPPVAGAEFFEVFGYLSRQSLRAQSRFANAYTFRWR